MKIVKKKMKYYGTVDVKKKIIYVDPKKNKNPKEMADTIRHEKLHIKYPNASEKTIRAKAKKVTQKKGKK